MFDCCSQRSHITAPLKFELGLPVVGIDSFGQSMARYARVKLSKLGIKIACGATAYVQAYYVVPVLF